MSDLRSAVEIVKQQIITDREQFKKLSDEATLTALVYGSVIDECDNVIEYLDKLVFKHSSEK
jgi:hypothetical protein